MNWFLGLLLVLVLIYLYRHNAKKKALKKLKNSLLENWGKKPAEKRFDFTIIGNYFLNNRNREKAFHIISEKTQIDLDLHELFKNIDSTCSKIGQQYLYFKLRTVQSIEKLLKFDSLTQLFLQHKTLRINCQLLLSQLNTNSAYDLEKLIHGKQVKKSNILWLVYSLNIATILFFCLGFYNSIFFFFIVPIYLVNMFLHVKNKKNVSYYLSGVKQLSKASRVAKELSEFKEIKQQYGTFPFLKKIDAIKLKTEFLGFETTLLTNEYFLAIWMLIELVKVLFNIEYIIFNSFIEGVTKEKDSIEELFVFIGEIDAAIATASLKSRDIETCTPVFTNEKQISAEAISHPLVEDCISNNLHIQDKNVLITGSNMSGKTTFIRAIAINSLVAQTLNVCFAKAYKAPFFKLYSSIRIADDVLKSTSYYLEEVVAVKELINASAAKEPCLFILDELFKGTNTIERISGGKGILTYLGKQNNMVFVSTHDIELTELLQAESYELYHFSETIANEVLVFDHKIKAGKLKTQNAIKILELYEYPEEIILDAKKTKRDYF
ncbi:DNA mismatch repair protein MutS [Kordia antarctica]|uniref:DNA mismatch repair protein MutS n=1 Tax=Kordia antarctica TaxID=1218801 RepID=A0A7L4ZL46_9FLAO|nr:DNA mismatch repair protein MutS [Kordia antarctica]QHI37139.1 DNA mismatch repair protein MutS [Kordia antarctica]